MVLLEQEEVLRAIITGDSAGTDHTHLYEVIEKMEPIRIMKCPDCVYWEDTGENVTSSVCLRRNEPVSENDFCSKGAIFVCIKR